MPAAAGASTERAGGGGASALRLGVDVGGTNTDAAVVRLGEGEGRVEVLGAAKRPTSRDVLAGAAEAIAEALARADVAPGEVSAAICGTTHFVNALLTRRGLTEVGVLRLCLPSGQALPPFSDVPPRLAAALGRHFRLLPGGVEHDGAPIAALDEAATRRAAVELVKEGARSLVVSQAFAPVRREQEDAAAEWIRDELTQQGYHVFFGAHPAWSSNGREAVDVSASADVAGIGLLERENAAILNAALRPLARRLVGALTSLGSAAGLRCPVLLTQNDGSVADIAAAAGLPIRCVQSGPVNSAVGALCLGGVKDCIFVDVGGTTSDVGQLVNGVPRPSSRDAFIARVRTNYEMPDVLSVPLGGGTVVGEDGSLGPGSVGQALASEARCFGGRMLTATCVALALGKVAIDCPLPSAAAGEPLLDGAWARIQEVLADAVEAQRTSDARIAVVVVGGGAFLCGGQLEGADVLVPPHADCANAVGAACARVSGSVDLVECVTPERRDAALSRVRALAIASAEAAGAEPGSVEVVSLEEVPLAYMPGGAARLKARALGRLRAAPLAAGGGPRNGGGAPDFGPPPEPLSAAELLHLSSTAAEEPGDAGVEVPGPPAVRGGVWEVSAADVEALALGVGVLGCGGGGSPYSAVVRLKMLLAAGKQARIIHLDEAPDGGVTIGGYMGAPTVDAEILPSSELSVAASALAEEGGVAFMASEIGGGNGMEPLVLSAEADGKVVLDGDLMGRAFPELQMQTSAFAGLPLTPCALADKHGNVVVVKHAASPKKLEDLLRPVCSEMGCAAGLVERPISVKECREVAVPNTLSHAWRLGRAVLEARRDHQDPIAAILGAYPGGRLLCVGKVVDVCRRTTAGFARGSLRLRGRGDFAVDFQNEFLIARSADGRADGAVLGSVPDLLCLAETATGRPIATEEVRYGLRVSLLCLPAPPQLRTEAALREVSPGAFGYTEVVYEPVGEYAPPLPVTRSAEGSCR